ncbi:MAG TPA: tripartite tricarboxylate transporter substrate binding protein [Burkholderiales bacterium]|nr:tripartite tricarboxylate transporter substrate binding protein [Burkholderiales bacterium]
MKYLFRFAVACMLFAAAAAMAQTPKSGYPVRSVRWVVPYPPGASNDVVARLLAQKLSETWGQQVVTDNRGGAGGLVGADIVAKATPDGYTLLMTNPGSNAINFALRTKTPYRPEDFAPVTLLGWSPIMLVTSATFPAATMKELIAMAKAKPGQLSGGSSGPGGSSHLALELFKLLTGTDILHVPYKGAAPAITDMIGGQVSMIFTTPVTAQPLIRAGKLKTLAVAGNKRLDIYPDVPTTAEQGLKGYDVLIWFGVSAPAGTPRALVLKLNRDLQQTIMAPEVKERFATLGLEPQGSTPEEFGRIIREDIERWSKVVKAANITQ